VDHQLINIDGVTHGESHERIVVKSGVHVPSLPQNLVLNKVPQVGPRANVSFEIDEGGADFGKGERHFIRVSEAFGILRVHREGYHLPIVRYGRVHLKKHRSVVPVISNRAFALNLASESGKDTEDILGNYL